MKDKTHSQQDLFTKFPRTKGTYSKSTQNKTRLNNAKKSRRGFYIKKNIKGLLFILNSSNCEKYRVRVPEKFF